MMLRVVAGRQVLGLGLARRILVPAALVVTFAGLGTPTVVQAKGPDFYAPVTVTIAGRSGGRTFDANGGADGQAVWEFVQQVADPSDSPVAARTVNNPGLTDYYEMHFAQGPTAPMKLPWTGMPTSRFYYYPTRAGIPPHVRLQLARESEISHDTWVRANPSLVAMVERHTRGLASESPGPHGRSLAFVGVAAGCILAAILLVLAVARRKLTSLAASPTPFSAG